MTPVPSRARAVLPAVVLASLGGGVLPACTPSHPLAPTARAVAPAPETVTWAPARREDVAGFFESERITGDAAATLRRVWYSFAADGTWSGAALVDDGGRTAFQVLSGRWTVDGGVLRLGGDSAPARAFAAPDRLRLDSDGGSVLFRRAHLD